MKKSIKISAIIFLILFIPLFFLSTFVKNYINNNSEELLGRRVHLEELHINYLRVSIKMEDFTLWEENKRDTFVSFSHLAINFDPWALLSNELSFSEISLTNPNISVVKNQDLFNFSDLIPESDSLVTDSLEGKELDEENFRFSIRNISLAGGAINFLDQEVSNTLYFDNLNLHLPEIAWNSTQSDVGVKFNLGETGEVTIAASINQADQNFRIQTTTENIEIGLLNNYLKEYIKASSIEGFFSSNLQFTGSLEEISNIKLTGQTEIKNFILLDLEGNKVYEHKNFTTNMKEINLEDGNFKFTSIKLQSPSVNAKLYKESDNLSSLLITASPQDSTMGTPEPIEVDTTEQPIKFSIDTFEVINAAIYFTDNTLNRPFKYDLLNINLSATGLSESAPTVPIVISANLNNQGQFTANSTINMSEPNNFAVKAGIENLELLSFSPYSEFFIASPITQGKFNYECTLNMTPTHIENQNKIKIKELEFGKRTKDKTSVKAPVRLALYLIKDSKDNIKIDLPVEGDPSNPDFSYGKILWKTLSNFLIKTASEPFKVLASITGTNPESLKTLTFELGQDTLIESQKAILSKISNIMEKKPQLTFSFSQRTNIKEELAIIAINRVKRDFINATSPGMDSLSVLSQQQKLKPTNEQFIQYVNNKSGAEDLRPLNEKCQSIIGESIIQAQFQTLLKQRNQQIVNFFEANAGIPKSSYQIQTADLRNLPEQLQNPEFKIEVSLNDKK